MFILTFWFSTFEKDLNNIDDCPQATSKCQDHHIRMFHHADLRINHMFEKNLRFCLKISVYKVIENLVKHGRHCMLHQIFNDFILSAMLLHQ